MSSNEHSSSFVAPIAESPESYTAGMQNSGSWSSRRRESAQTLEDWRGLASTATDRLDNPGNPDRMNIVFRAGTGGLHSAEN